jgi:hypothetical protein
VTGELIIVAKETRVWASTFFDADESLVFDDESLAIVLEVVTLPYERLFIRALFAEGIWLVHSSRIRLHSKCLPVLK